jgi:hypothetical protein
MGDKDCTGETSESNQQTENKMATNMAVNMTNVP